MGPHMGGKMKHVLMPAMQKTRESSTRIALPFMHLQCSMALAGLHKSFDTL